MMAKVEAATIWIRDSYIRHACLSLGVTLLVADYCYHHRNVKKPKDKKKKVEAATIWIRDSYIRHACLSLGVVTYC